MWPLTNIWSLLKKDDEGGYTYRIEAKVLKVWLDEEFWNTYEAKEVMDKIAEKIARDIYKEIRADILANKKFRKAMLEKVILEIARSNKELLKQLT